ncbi:hypothetical protein BBJ29_001666 [Phytophthora kernoviae]|uniref:Uncharacterized protein n=1 Tax=Phytophthora kernoviae TaxID=325452 RepID=A0A3F2RTN4_9STRA|nr:hypothetical protein BBP00_00004390 [Phytophthora kernoviae]RLN71083.1 hypothetical protein BBJ29_001666 [Phytophthora kernoviae]
MEKSTTPPHTLEYAPLCKQLSVVLFGVFLVSFTVTWYKVWWDTLIGLAVAVYGYYILRDINPANLNAQKIRYFHYGTVASVASHVIALGVTTYFVIKIYLLDKVVDLESGPGISLFVFLYIFLLLEIGVTRQETLLEREEYLAGVQRRVEAYENCVAAITAATTSLQELSGHLDAMQLATQQLNAFTGGWLAVWKRPSA